MLKEMLDGIAEVVDSLDELREVSKKTTLSTVSTTKNTTSYSGGYPPESKNLDELKRRLQAKYDNSEKPQSILDRANKNIAEFDEDEVLKEMESEHDHSEHSDKIVAHPVYDNPDNRGHPDHPEDDILSLGSTEDLIVKGYDGKLEYERDFVREGEDFLARISII